MKKEPKLGNSGGVFNVEMKLRTFVKIQEFQYAQRNVNKDIWSSFR